MGHGFAARTPLYAPVDNCHRVIRCVNALMHSGVASALTVLGIIDGDYNPASYRSSLPDAVTMLKVHEVESLLCLPEVVSAVCDHVSLPYEEAR